MKTNQLESFVYAARRNRIACKRARRQAARDALRIERLDALATELADAGTVDEELGHRWEAEEV